MPQQTFEDEARQLADDEHHDLTRRVEEMRDQPRFYNEGDIHWFSRDYNYRADPAEFFLANRDEFLEKALEEFTVRTAQ